MALLSLVRCPGLASVVDIPVNVSFVSSFRQFLQTPPDGSKPCFLTSFLCCHLLSPLLLLRCFFLFFGRPQESVVRGRRPRLPLPFYLQSIPPFFPDELTGQRRQNVIRGTPPCAPCESKRFPFMCVRGGVIEEDGGRKALPQFNYVPPKNANKELPSLRYFPTYFPVAPTFFSWPPPEIRLSHHPPSSCASTKLVARLFSLNVGHAGPSPPLEPPSPSPPRAFLFSTVRQHRSDGSTPPPL